MLQVMSESNRGNENPQEIVGHGDCLSDGDGTAIAREFVENDGEADLFGNSDALQESFQSSRIEISLSSEDGLPTPLDKVSLQFAPSLSYENLVCMGDDRQYVEIWKDEDEGPRHPHLASLLDERPEWGLSGERQERRTFAKDVVQSRWGRDVVSVEDDGSGAPRLVLVRPRRAPCEHYRRAVFCRDPEIPYGEFGHAEMQRICTARRSVGGAYMSLNDEAVYACQLRVPADPASEDQHIHSKERERLSQVVERVPLFNLT